ncbi:type 1 glutamine amidotransferase [Dysosmobacter sp.]|uniref:type 1 glutamine amidotransferase n=1 Tax=Dysosmobacter sp. TaxID=2591382 RepID=UPI002A861D44|nr:hypothetical protein [Dysosmobacter sp.]MDY3281177.1 hypothetical protein [Dysosmobacter sp.]
MDVKIIHFYPDLMNLYGGWANVAVLRRHLEDLGHSVTVEAVVPGKTADLTGADFLYLGAGTERAQKAALEDLRQYGPALEAAVSGGAAVLFAGTAMDLLGQTITDKEGTVYRGLGLAEFSTVQGPKRFVEDVYGFTDLYPEPVVGFMNKSSVTAGVEHPLLKELKMGIGNEGPDTPEGYCRGTLLASQLTGPLLVKNPKLLDTVVEAIYRRRGEALPENRPAYPDEARSYAVTAEQLRLRWDKQ